MVSRRGRPLDNDQLVRIFAENVAAQTDAIWAGNARKGNRCADRYHHAYRCLRERGSEGLDALSRLLTHQRPDVRVAAAAYLLKYKTGEALAVLRELAKKPSLVGFEAGEAIKRWEEGEWHLDE